MKIAAIMADTKSGQTKNLDHVVFVDKNEASILICAMVDYCKANPRKQMAKKMLKQMDTEFAIFGG